MIGLGLGLGFSRQVPSAAGFDLASIAWDGSWPTYTAADGWVGEASAGDSEGRNLTGSGAPQKPADGTPVSGKVPAVYDGVANVTRDASNAAGTYMDASAYTIVMLAKVRSAAALAGSIFGNKHLIADNSGYFGLAAYDDDGDLKIFAYHDAGGSEPVATSEIDIPEDAYAVIVWSYDGTDISLDVNESGSPVTAPAGNMVAGAASAVFRQGANWNSTVFTEMDVLDIRAIKSSLSSEDRANVYAGLKARYPGAGLP